MAGLASVTAYSVCLIAAALTVLSAVVLVADTGRYHVELQAQGGGANADSGHALYTFTLWQLCSDAGDDSLPLTFTGCGDWNRSFPLVGVGSNVRRSPVPSWDHA